MASDDRATQTLHFLLHDQIPEHRQQVDAELAGKLAGLGDHAAARAAARIAQRLDAAVGVASYWRDRRVRGRGRPVRLPS